MLEVGLSALEVLEKYYDGEKLGVWEGDFVRNEKRRGIKLPKILCDFLESYGYTDVNFGKNQLWLPDKIDTDRAKVDGELRDILIIGSFHDSLVAILAKDYDKEKPAVYFDDLPEENGEEVTLVFHKSDLDFEEFLKILVLESPAIYNNSLVCDDPEEAKKALEGYESEALTETMRKTARPGRFICWDAEKREFLAVLLTSDREILVRFAPGFSARELESLFNREFYENSQNCDYKHALKIILNLVDLLEKRKVDGVFLAEKYMQTGRCYWALRQWGEAEAFYQKAEKIFGREMRAMLEKCQSFYEGLGNFYLAKEDIFKSQKAYREVDRVCEVLGTGGARRKGNRLLQQAAIMLESNKPEKAVELYEQALKVFQEEPKECKYEIARCQQLLGEAKKKLKQDRMQAEADTK